MLTLALGLLFFLFSGGFRDSAMPTRIRSVLRNRLHWRGFRDGLVLGFAGHPTEAEPGDPFEAGQVGLEARL